jgi:hypothetical protein
MTITIQNLRLIDNAQAMPSCDNVAVFNFEAPLYTKAEDIPGI